MTIVKTVLILVSLLVTLPIGFWLQYQVLVRVQATELMWFLYWVNVPLWAVVHILSRIIGEKTK